jgi:hypothetical protein
MTAGALCVALAGGVASATDMPTKAPKAPRSASYASADGNYYFLYNQELRYVTWEGSRGYRPDIVPRNPNPGSGSQFYMPMALQMFGKPARDWSFDVLLRAGYVDSRQTTTGQSGSYSGMIDTIFTGKIAYHGNPNFIPFFALTTNLPTGERKLNGTSAFARMDPDIVDVPTFGEGFNIGPTIGVLVPTRAGTFSFALGHTSRGTYTRDDPVLVVRTVDPGDETTVAFRYLLSLGPLSMTAGLSYAWDTTTTVTNSAGFATVKPGDRTSINAGASYQWSAHWTTVAGLGWTHTQANDYRNSTTAALQPQPGNANGDTFRANLGQYHFMGPWTFALNGSYLKRDANEYSPSLVEFIPAKTKWQLDGLVSYMPAPNIRLDARVARIWTHEDATADWFIPLFPPACCAFPGTGIPEVSQDAWAFTLGGVVTFDAGGVPNGRGWR